MLGRSCFAAAAVPAALPPAAPAAPPQFFRLPPIPPPACLPMNPVLHRFYTKVLGFRAIPRPDLGFPGVHHTCRLAPAPAELLVRGERTAVTCVACPTCRVLAQGAGRDDSHHPGGASTPNSLPALVLLHRSRAAAQCPLPSPCLLTPLCIWPAERPHGAAPPQGLEGRALAPACLPVCADHPAAASACQACQGLAIAMGVAAAPACSPPPHAKPQERYTREPEAWFIRRNSHIALEASPGGSCTRGALAAGVGRVALGKTGRRPAVGAAGAAPRLPARPAAPLQVEDFEAAEAALRRHGVEYSRHVLPEADMRQVGAALRSVWLGVWCWAACTLSTSLPRCLPSIPPARSCSASTPRAMAWSWGATRTPGGLGAGGPAAGAFPACSPAPCCCSPPLQALLAGARRGRRLAVNPPSNSTSTVLLPVSPSHSNLFYPS